MVRWLKAKPGEQIVGWKAIAREIGVTVDRLRGWLRGAGIRLPKVGRGRNAPVYLVWGELSLVIKNGVKAVQEHRRTP